MLTDHILNSTPFKTSTTLHRTEAKFQQDACNVFAMPNSWIAPTLLQKFMELKWSAENTRRQYIKRYSGLTLCLTSSSVSTTSWEKLASLWSIGLDTELKLKDSRRLSCLPSTWSSWTQEFSFSWSTPTWWNNLFPLDLMAQCLISTRTGSELLETPFVQLWYSTLTTPFWSSLGSSQWDWPTALWTAVLLTSTRLRPSQSKLTLTLDADPLTWCTSSTLQSWTSSSSPSCLALVFQNCSQLLLFHFW